jgi:transcriptional regulator with XRE-family HTH domain
MKEDVLVAFGRKVRAFRDKLGLSQEQLADKCGMDRTYISGIERGLRNVSLKNIVLLSEALEIQPSQLLK